MMNEFLKATQQTGSRWDWNMILPDCKSKLTAGLTMQIIMSEKLHTQNCMVASSESFK